MAVFDATVLLPVLWSEVPPPTDPATGQPVIFFRERINQLIQNLQKRRTRVIIPTPALSEILVRAGPAAADYLDQLTASNAFRIEPFDERTAAEVAVMTSNALSEGDKRGRGEGLWVENQI